MARRGSRFSPRHLLALCTFLVPLALLGWFGAAELTRQGEEAQATLVTKAIAFLNSAERAMNKHFDDLLSEALRQSVQAMETTEPALTGSLAAAVRDMRESRDGVPEALDLLLLDEDGGLMAPKPAEVELGLPFSRPSVPRSRGENATALGAAEAMALRGDHTQARATLQALEQAMRSRRTGTQGPESTTEVEVRLHFQLGAVERKLGNIAAAREQYERVRQATPRFQRNTDLAALDLLAEVALAELAEPDDGPAARLVVMQEIADGNRDELPDTLLQGVMERLLAGVPEEARQRADAHDARRNDDARRHSRTFAAEYESTHVQAVRKRLQKAEAEDRPVYYAFGAGSSGSLLAIRRATSDEQGRHNCSYVCLRLDLAPMLAEFINDYVEDDGRGFVLAVEDADGVPVVAGPRAPAAGFDLPERQNHGLSLIAQPTDVDTLVRNTEAAARNRGLLIATLFAVALGGAFWLWRSVTRAADLAATKVDFVSRVSHELKTPLALIRMYGETLGMGRAQGEGQVQRFGGIVAREADRLTTMIQRILDFSRQQSGSLTYAPVPTDLREQLQGIADAYLPHLQAKGASLSTDLAAELHARVDAAALESAVVNLLENAIKYQATDTPDSRIDLVLSRSSTMARIDVVDRGRGVPESERHRIFESFYRASNAGEVRGAGLGLSLVRHFAEAHGGSVAALPREGSGSIFRLELPLIATGP